MTFAVFSFYIMQIIGRYQRYPQLRRQGRQKRIELLLLRHAVVLQLHIKMFRPKKLQVFPRQRLGFFLLPSQQRRWDLSRQTSAQRDNSFLIFR